MSLADLPPILEIEDQIINSNLIQLPLIPAFTMVKITINYAQEFE